MEFVRDRYHRNHRNDGGGGGGERAGLVRMRRKEMRETYEIRRTQTDPGNLQTASLEGLTSPSLRAPRGLRGGISGLVGCKLWLAKGFKLVLERACV